MPEVQETQFHSLGREDPLEEEMATHSRILAWENSMDRGAWWAAIHGVAKSQTRLGTQHLLDSQRCANLCCTASDPAIHIQTFFF